MQEPAQHRLPPGEFNGRTAAPADAQQRSSHLNPQQQQQEQQQQQQQQLEVEQLARRSFDSGGGIPHVYSNERLHQGLALIVPFPPWFTWQLDTIHCFCFAAHSLYQSLRQVTRWLLCCAEQHPAAMERPAHGSSEALDRLGPPALAGRSLSSSEVDPAALRAGPPGAQQGGHHRRRTGSGTEDDIFSAVGGIEMDAEHRSSSYGHGVQPNPQPSAVRAALCLPQGSMLHACYVQRPSQWCCYCPMTSCLLRRMEGVREVIGMLMQWGVL